MSAEPGVFPFSRNAGITTEGTLRVALATDSAGTGGALGLIQAQSDCVQTFSWYDPGTTDQRVHTIVYSSATLGQTATQTFAYAGSSGSYRLSTITNS